jgi:cytochrome oxidase Cu insertion factor (SCO1/SenC/PrrC family)
MMFSLGEHHVKKMPYYGEYTVIESGDTVYQPVPDLHLMRSDGEQISLKEFQNRALVINRFSLPCDDDCRTRGATLANYLNELTETDKWAILNLCVDVDADLNELKAVAKAHDIGMKNWYFASALDAKEIEKFLKYVFVETKQANTTSELLDETFVLLDQNHVVREFFDSKIYQENKKLEDAIKMTLKESHMSWKNK